MLWESRPVLRGSGLRAGRGPGSELPRIRGPGSEGLCDSVQMFVRDPEGLVTLLLNMVFTWTSLFLVVQVSPILRPLAFSASPVHTFFLSDH